MFYEIMFFNLPKVSFTLPKKRSEMATPVRRARDMINIDLNMILEKRNRSKTLSKIGYSYDILFLHLRNHALKINFYGWFSNYMLGSSGVKCLVVAQVLTVTALGASIFLLIAVPSVPILPSMEGTPRYLIHPLFLLQFLLMASTVIVWLIVFLFSLYDVRRRGKMLTEIVRRDWFGFSLVVFTVVVAVSGCVGYSEDIYFEEFGAGDLLSLPGLRPPNIFMFLRTVNAIGFLLCEPAWIIKILSRYLRH